ncbi:MAG TPA: porin family protein [Bacteroidales bacterium]|nr:porin family protein [Bacteroidales bacterium]
MKTKRLIITAMVSIMLLSFPAIAQISVGTRQGISFSTLSKIGDIYDNNQFTTSYTGGIFLTVPVKGHLSFAPEVNFIRKGRSDEQNEITLGNVSKHYDYLQVPVMVRYNSTLTESDNYTIFFNAGPYAGFLLKSQTKKAGSSEWINDSYESNDKDPDFGLMAGGGVTVPLNKCKLQFDLRYEMGLSKLNNQPEDYRTKAISLAAGILF